MFKGVTRSIQGVYDLFAPTNKSKEQLDNEIIEGAYGTPLAELSLDMDDEELIALAQSWEDNYSEYENKIKEKQKMSEQYWLGTQKDIAYGDSSKDNLIFASLETFLPLVTQTNPEPLVYSDNTPEGNDVCDKIKDMLAFQMDELVLRQKVRKMVRHWSLYYMGTVQVGWDPKRNDIDTYVVNPKMLVLDPDATISENGVYEGEYLGKRIQTTASKLANVFPEHKDYIEQSVDGKMGTRVTYTEWWTDTALFYKYKDKILIKLKNPHFNYDQEEVRLDPETGAEIKELSKATNHFEYPQMPFVFLTVYNLGTTPHDTTSLIEQNIPLQRRINKRNNQIDQNVDGMNNGIAVSGKAFTKEQATEAANALRQGNPLYVPSGDISGAFEQLNTPSLPNEVYQSLQDYREELRTVFGIAGSTPQGIEEDRTVRGKIMRRQSDATRNSFPIEAIEQVYDRIFNWWTQLFAVYYDEAHSASIIGVGNALKLAELRSSDINRKIQVSVREGSLIPKDPVTQQNLAVDLFQMGALDPKALFEKLDFADPIGSARDLMLFKADPMMYMQEVLGSQPMIPQGGQTVNPDSVGAPQAGQDVSAPAHGPSLSDVQM